MSSDMSVMASAYGLMPSLNDTPEVSLNAIPDLIPDTSPMSDPSINSTPYQESEEREYFNSKSISKHEILFRPNTTTSIIASQVAEKKKMCKYIPANFKDILCQELNPAHSIFNPTPFEPSAEGPCFATTSQTFWYHKASSQLRKLLRNASYPLDFEAQYMEFFNHSIIPALGPIPSSSPNWTSHLTHTRSPFEPSWSICGQDNVKPKQHVSFTIEPISAIAGTNGDPFNQIVSRFLVSALAASKTFGTIDLTLWHKFMDELFVSPTETQRASELPLGSSLPSCYLAFDFPNDDFAPTLKACLFPHRRALLDGKSKTEVLLSVVSKLHSHTTSFLSGIETIERFLAKTRSNEEAQRQQDNESSKDEMSLEMLSCDCLPTNQQLSIELYLRTNNTSVSNIEHVYSLGGVRNSPETTAGLALFIQFFKFLTTSSLQAQRNAREHKNQTQALHHLYFALSLHPRIPEPKVQIYIPLWTLGLTDYEIRERLGKYFTGRGWGTDAYEEVGKGKPMTHTYLSFSYSEVSGVELNICYSPLMENL